MKVALYARVSTAEEKELQDPENQLVRLRDYCKFRQWNIAKEYKEYRSGLDDHRPVLKEMLDDAQKGRFGYIVVFKLDRLTRSPSKLIQIMDRLKDGEGRYLVHLVSANEGLDTSNKYAEGMLIMLGVVAEGTQATIQEAVAKAPEPEREIDECKTATPAPASSPRPVETPKAEEDVIARNRQMLARAGDMGRAAQEEEANRLYASNLGEDGKYHCHEDGCTSKPYDTAVGLAAHMRIKHNPEEVHVRAP